MPVPLLRRAEVGPYTVSLWQVYPEVGSAIFPHLIVMFDDGMPDEGAVVSVRVGSELIVFIPMIVAMWLHTRPSQNHLNDCSCAAPPVERAKAGLASV